MAKNAIRRNIGKLLALGILIVGAAGYLWWHARPGKHPNS